MQVIVMGSDDDVRSRLSSYGYAHKSTTNVGVEVIQRLTRDFDVLFTGGSIVVMWLHTKNSRRYS